MADSSKSSLVSFNPSAEMRRLQREIDSLFSNIQDELERRHHEKHDPDEEVEIPLTSARAAIQHTKKILDGMKSDLESIEATADEISAAYRSAPEA